jgi:phosphatidate cytidylyltransferase
LAPQISPKKTIEGSIGGILFSIFFASLFAALVYKCPPLSAALFGVGIGGVGSIVAQCGDLFFSLIKRKLGIKDYGNLIPGHGGVLDRIDSLLFVAPYLLIILSIKSAI